MIDINSAWEELRKNIQNCERCGLCKTRHNIVFGDGPRDSKVILIGEAPGQEEDETGKPFVGRAGRLLTDILEKGGGIKRESLYITNIVKCRPPENRDPNPEEISSCITFLEQQILLLHPKIIVSMGRISTQRILNTTTRMSDLRGKYFEWRGVEVFPMFHPSYLLRNDSNAVGSPKYLTWQDVQVLKKKIDEL